MSFLHFIYLYNALYKSDITVVLAARYVQYMYVIIELANWITCKVKVTTLTVIKIFLSITFLQFNTIYAYVQLYP